MLKIKSPIYCGACASMFIYYEYFGDVISLDSTYFTNSSHRSFFVLYGFNHHQRFGNFRIVLLYDKTIDSYKWLFDIVIEACKKKMPQTIFIDQDQEITRALYEVILRAYHGLSIRHLMQNNIYQLHNLMKGGTCLPGDLKK